MPFVEFVNPACTSDIILERCLVADRPEVFLIQRGEEPYKGMWAWPGGHKNLGIENCRQTAARELEEETGYVVNIKDLKLLNEYSDPDRDPRGDYVTHAYYTDKFSGTPEAADDAADARWFYIDDMPKLAFDHEKIFQDYLEVRK